MNDEERGLNERKQLLELDLHQSAIALGMALLKKTAAAPIRKKLEEIESELKDIDAMLLAMPLYLDEKRDAAHAAAPKVDKEAIARALSQPSTARAGSEEDYWREKKRFEDEFDKLKDTTYLVPRAKELFKLAKSCNGTIVTHVEQFLRKYEKLRRTKLF